MRMPSYIPPTLPSVFCLPLLLQCRRRSPCGDPRPSPGCHPSSSRRARLQRCAQHCAGRERPTFPSSPPFWNPAYNCFSLKTKRAAYSAALSTTYLTPITYASGATPPIPTQSQATPRMKVQEQQQPMCCCQELNKFLCRHHYYKPREDLA